MRNPLLPFAAIAIVAIIAMVSLSYFGVNQAQQAAEGPAVTEMNPEDLYAAQGCAGCHGGNLEGGVGPALTGVGERLSADEITNIIINGKGSMPGGLASAEEADILTTWLLEQ
ncbi:MULTISPECIES: cytochrome c550 [Exiguobacterium]|uniref:Cytochrome c551 n=1 Tax=Exiguobacterium aurantiacum TaxID=33987 RepID=A0A377FSN8_9BACL|nr:MULTISPECIES: cytochrome c [Exiguobacterium]STO07819.1 Cytochrome c551 [Exiguobacterium aurantiacum]